jgi:hypothetical protein
MQNATIELYRALHPSSQDSQQHHQGGRQRQANRLRGSDIKFLAALGISTLRKESRTR